jgi:hypothetical protein
MMNNVEVKALKCYFLQVNETPSELYQFAKKDIKQCEIRD